MPLYATPRTHLFMKISSESINRKYECSTFSWAFTIFSSMATGSTTLRPFIVLLQVSQIAKRLTQQRQKENWAECGLASVLTYILAQKLINWKKKTSPKPSTHPCERTNSAVKCLYSTKRCSRDCTCEQKTHSSPSSGWRCVLYLFLVIIPCMTLYWRSVVQFSICSL